ncbi:uncharacterized protein LOC110811709 isoform X1 [Carica papaya]|uniref:uncharacterized protein LOC110811709 isoform X1 n=1 Tax=Carica papaya TaxID=3649 RepID=UPI000B8CB851|nr:uncharacterized protein LOC110811709 isoform X1 [Carica papaya]XP_021893963.1 uncharacterized protein LOC110811709 isoform X1 [Carica papaya]XP_021893964.1 uncharacterized protein LOC110811709 isoform X1 [Carica papaya]XP_021893965.1 uncharacterized protein LOC110811709 isoform X1 [Carica papaya]XP_021893966.1 uncharacterized protein LOC110811709 isoform X1 [Carica papaya]
MKEIEKRRTSNDIQSKRSGKTGRKDQKQQSNGSKNLNAKHREPKVLNSKAGSNMRGSEPTAGSQLPEVYEELVIHYVDEVNKLEQTPQDPKANTAAEKTKKDENLDGHSSDFDKDREQEKEYESDSDTIRDSTSSQGDSFATEDENVESAVKVSKSNNSSDICPNEGTAGSDGEANQLQPKTISNTPNKSVTVSGVPANITVNNPTKNSENFQDHSKSSGGTYDGNIQEIKKVDVLDEASNGAHSVEHDNDTVDAEENGMLDNEEALNQKIEDMEMRIEKLEEELREVAALEISLYSVVPEHGSSAHKVHTPARRLSRLYIHACKHWTQNKRATIAKNTVSGLVLIAKSCGSDVSRLTFWLSNTIVLREIISQAFGSVHTSSPGSRLSESNGGSKRSEGRFATLKWKGSSSGKQVNDLMHSLEDWQETGTFTAALEKIESWIFSRIVESVWWQALTPHMQSPMEDSSTSKTIRKLLGPALGDQQQGSFSINLWKNAFQDAFQRLCPVRAGGHECGCLPLLARMVMAQCIARLDVAMFNAILRESVHEIPTDPVSDPIVDSKVLPIPAGDLSFGSGAQLKNSIGNWSRWLADMLGMDAGSSPKEDEKSSEEDYRQVGEDETKSFILLDHLSDLLMLPKDMLVDRSVRKEVCPSISLPLIKRILCNFTPDEFCPDSVPGSVLEALNAESIVERRLSGDSARSFPYSAAPVVYTPPSSADVAEKVAEVGGNSQLTRNISVVQRKGYTSDEELEELDSPLTSIIDKMPSSPLILSNGGGKHKEHAGYGSINARYILLREVWST